MLQEQQFSKRLLLNPFNVSGNPEKRRRYLYSSRHSITSRSLKADLKFLSVCPYTSVISFTFIIFF
jgi:hypothetical protein